MKRLALFPILGLLIFACKKESNPGTYNATQIHQIPYGGSGEMAGGNYSGQGTITNTAGTTVTLNDNATIDGLSINGTFIVPAGKTLTVNEVVHVGGASNLYVYGALKTKNLTQVGNLYTHNAFISVNNKFTIGGGTTLKTAVSKFTCSELVIIGHISGVDNSETKKDKYYSVFDFHSSNYLNRGGGTNVCGPVAFTTNADQGASGKKLNEVTNGVISIKPDFYSLFNLDQNKKLFEYDDNCGGISGF